LSERHAPNTLGDQADGLRRLFGTQAVTLAVAARETDVIDAYARIKRVVHEQCCHHFKISITHARSAEEAQTVFDNLQRVAREYLGVRLEYLGMAPGAATKGAASARSPRSGMALHDSVL
jgi:MinD-like ATPase involved in chromosome partitioning or flagellar assembly